MRSPSPPSEENFSGDTQQVVDVHPFLNVNQSQRGGQMSLQQRAAILVGTLAAVVATTGAIATAKGYQPGRHILVAAIILAIVAVAFLCCDSLRNEDHSRPHARTSPQESDVAPSFNQS